ncbi:MAG TPA: hypothetical protein VIK94_02235 [Bacilli bacterium]
MKKIFFILFIFLMFGLAGCKPKDKGNKNDVDFFQYLLNTQEEYEDSESGNIKITVINEGVTTTLEYVYNYSGNVIKSLKVVLTEGDTTMEAYIKDNYSYVNIDGVKTKERFFDSESRAIIESYGFTQLTESVFDAFDKSLFGAFEVVSNENGEAQLDWNPDKYVFLDDDIQDNPEEWIKADERFRAVKDNISDITVTLKYADEKVTSLDSTWKDKDNVESKIKIEFNGTGTQTITYPSDLNEYIDR